MGDYGNLINQKKQVDPNVANQLANAFGGNNNQQQDPRQRLAQKMADSEAQASDVYQQMGEAIRKRQQNAGQLSGGGSNQ